MAVDRSVLVLYGSETGNAQDLAEETGRLCQRLHFRSVVEELDSVDLVSALLASSSSHTQIHLLTSSLSPP
jgi:sulfite reductase alpha subunit-like flavoprotein